MMSSEQAKACAQSIAGYLLVRELGKGGMGIVYLAIREADGVVVALKTIISAVAPSPDDIERFLREADILRELDHPNIVAFRDMGECDGRFFFAMDYVRGIDAAHLLGERGPLPVDRAARIACQLLEALEYAHAKGFVHRDLKPANVLLTSVAGREVVKLADFGLARTYQASTLSGITITGTMAGTPPFMPPEQILNFRNVKPAADQYAAAALLYNLLTDRYIHDFPPSIQQKLLMIMQCDPEPILSRRPELPKELAAIIHRALAREPEKRFPDVKAFRKQLLKFG